MQQNTVTINAQTIKIARGPFGNTFVQHGNAKFVQEDGQDFVCFYALCTADSIEAGRIYYCYSTMQGELDSYFSVN